MFALWSTSTITHSFTLPSTTSTDSISSSSSKSGSSTSLHLVPQAGAQLAAASAAIYAKIEEEKKKEELSTVHSVGDDMRSNTKELNNMNDERLGRPIESLVGSVVATPTQAARVFLSSIFSLTSNHNDLVDSIPRTINNEEQLSNAKHRPSSLPLGPMKLESTDEQQHHHVDFSMLLPSFHHEDTEEDVVRYPITGFTLVTTTDDANPDQFQVHALPPPNTSRSTCDIIAMKESKTSPVYGWFSPACKLGNLYGDDGRYVNPVNPSNMDDFQ